MDQETIIREKIKAKTDRELLEDTVFYATKNEKHLSNISAYVTSFFWLSVLAVVGYIGLQIFFYSILGNW
jgi:hypothetical protein